MLPLKGFNAIGETCRFNKVHLSIPSHLKKALQNKAVLNHLFPPKDSSYLYSYFGRGCYICYVMFGSLDVIVYVLVCK